MPPAPGLGSKELIYEMAEVYELALLRDVDFAAFSATGAVNPKVQDALSRLNAYGQPPNTFLTRPRRLGVGQNQLTEQIFSGGRAPVSKSGLTSRNSC